MTRSGTRPSDGRPRLGGPKWRQLSRGEVETTRSRLASWPDSDVPAARHMFALSCLEASGPRSLKVVSDEAKWAAAVHLPGRLLAPMGDAELIERVGKPSRRWRLMVGDAAACEAVLADCDRSALIVHEQRFYVADPDLVPPEAVLADPGLRRAESADVDRLAELAVQLHVDDEFGPHPGRSGRRGYARRIADGVRRGLAWCVGPVGRPVVKLERSVSSRRWGVQLSGIVVAPDARGEGLGRGAVAAATREALAEPGGGSGRPVTLHVRAANTTARRAYEAAGFVDREEWRLVIRP